MNFYFARAGEIDENMRLSVPADERLERLAQAVELKPGAVFRVAAEGIGNGVAVATEVSSTALCAEFSLSEDTMPPDIDVILALPRPKVLKRVIPQLVSMGIRSLTLVNACGVQRQYFDTHWLEKDRIVDLVLRGTEQSGVFRPATIAVKKRLKPFIEDSLGDPERGELRLLCIPGGRRFSVSLEKDSRTLIAIGPETGWTEFEETMFEKAGFTRYGLSAEHLASDVAAIAIVGIVKSSVSA